MKRLYRSKKNKVLGGVLGGLAEYLDMDPVLPRIIFLVAFFFIKPISGFLVVAYIVSCIILPYKPYDLPENTEGSAREVTKAPASKDTQNILAWAFIIIGVLSLLIITKPFAFLLSLNSFTWPILLVLLGLLILIVSIQKSNRS
jgi:phage shock protein PspC (stress-responsive transcriptional regulator)